MIVSSIAITMTATLRPEILDKTLSSFRSNLFDGSEFLIINIDEVGERCKYKDLLTVINNYYPMRQVVGRTSPIGSFPDAFRWVWTQAMRFHFKYVFHLEDDWELLQKVDLGKMIHLMETTPNLYILRLSQFPTGEERSKTWNKYVYWTGEFFEPKPEDKGLLGFCGHPSLIKVDFIKAALETLDGMRNPEKHIKGHNPVMKPLYENGRFGVFSPQNAGPTIRDIGRNWMVKNGYRKQGDKANFTNWETLN